jgi:hypothetical protein
MLAEKFPAVCQPKTTWKGNISVFESQGRAGAAPAAAALE